MEEEEEREKWGGAAEEGGEEEEAEQQEQQEVAGGGRIHLTLLVWQRITTEFSQGSSVLSSTKPNSQSRLFPPRAGTEATAARKNLERIPTSRRQYCW